MTASRRPGRLAESMDLPKLTAGSWVYGTFSTWIGEKDKNLAWTFLIEAKKVCDRILASKVLSPEKEKAVLLHHFFD